jgi:hypothetical protein
MIDSSQYDVREIDNLILPFDVTTKELDPKPRIVDGQNLYVTTGGKLAKRPGFTTYAGFGAFPATLIPERLTCFSTVGDTSIFPVVSGRDLNIVSPKTWKLYWWDGAIWQGTAATDNSLVPHELTLVNGRGFIRDEAIGIYSQNYNARVLSVNSGVASLAPWGLPQNPATPVLVAPGSWPAAAGTVAVNIGWKYAYAYGNATGALTNEGHIGNSSASVDTGAFTNKKPQITITPINDPTVYPQIIIYRTTDGGGLFYEVGRVVNGGVPFTWTDNGTNDPLGDYALDPTRLGPDMVINSGPPARVYPSAYPDPAQSHSNIEWFAGRLWVAVKNRLFFSGREEIYAGVPEECFPDPNGVRGNWYILPHDIVSVRATQDKLFIHTTEDIYVVIGEDRMNLRLVNYARKHGMPVRQKLATATFGDIEFFVGKDWNVYAIIANNAPVNISKEIAPRLRTEVAADLSDGLLDIQLVTWTGNGYSWLVMLLNSKLFVFDLDRKFWYTPWVTGFLSVSSIAVGRLATSDVDTHLVIVGRSASTGESSLAVLDFNASQDAGVNYTAEATTNLLDLPSGNHVNMLRQPGHHPMLSYLKVERTKFTGDTTPTVAYRLDEFSGALTTGTATPPPFMSQRASYNTLWYPVQVVSQRVQVKITSAAENKPFEIQTFAAVFSPESGA